MAEQEVDDILIPVRRWIRDHYTKLTSSNETKCNHRNVKFTIYKNRLAILHEHLVRRHPEYYQKKRRKKINSIGLGTILSQKAIQRQHAKNVT